jgi:ABC-type amino acid transport substrate-binding protein
MREWGGKYLCAAFVALTMLMTGFFTGMASAGALDRINQEKAIRIAYREDAPPFSYKDKIGEPVGFMIDLCREVAKKLADQLQLASLNLVYVPVTAADRFETIQQQKADLLSEPTSATLTRREIVDFSIPTFVDGASLMIRADGPHDLPKTICRLSPTCSRCSAATRIFALPSTGRSATSTAAARSAPSSSAPSAPPSPARFLGTSYFITGLPD